MPESGLARPSHDESVEERTISTDVDFPTEESTEPELLGFGSEDIEPIPVYQVGVPPKDDELTDWSANRFTQSGTNPTQLAGDNHNRTRLFLRNHGPNSAFLTRRHGDAVFTGYELEINAELELLHTASVYVRCASAETAELSIVTEYSLARDEE